MALDHKRENTSLLEESDKDHAPYQDGPDTPNPPSRRPRSNKFVLILTFFLLVSLTINILTLPNIIRRPSNINNNNIPSPYASLLRKTRTPYVLLTDYASPNTTLRNKLWESINIDAGVVALPDTFAEGHNLRTAQRFPWDTSKGIYILHGFHNLHCLKIIYISIAEFRSGKEQTRSSHHIDHCLDALRRQILCDADDTPRATERRREVVTGVGQYRQCRDWNELETWARGYTACYRRPKDGDDGLPSIERFKHCPEGSGYVVDEEYVPIDEIVEGLPGESVAWGEDIDS